MSNVVTAQRLFDGVRRLLADQLAEPFSISGARWFTGGASNLHVGFTLIRGDPWRGGARQQLVVRMDATDSLTGARKLREHQLLGALGAALPVPRSLWIDADRRYFPRPALVCSVVEGIPRPEGGVRSSAAVPAIGFGRRLRAQLAPQFVDHLALLHQRSHLDGHDLSAFARPRAGTTEAARWRLDRARRAWEDTREEDVPLMEVAASWLESNLPRTEHVSIVHGDYRSGKFLFDPGSGRIAGWLGWGHAHFGDRHLDIATATHPLYGHFDTDGCTFLVSGLLGEAEFIDTYAMATGWEVDPIRLRWYQVLASYTLLIRALGSAHRIVRLGRSDQDIRFARADGIAPVALRDLGNRLAEVL